jgi:hypothetical protein
MASPQLQSIRPPAIRLSYGVPQLIALKAVTGRTVPSKFPDPRTGASEQVAFELIDGAPLYLSFEDAGELEHQLIALAIRAGDDFRLTKVKMPHGGGSAIRVERASNPQPYSGSRPERPAPRTYRPAVAQSDAEIEAKLTQSIDLARRDPETAREAFREAAAPASQPANQLTSQREPVGLALGLRVILEQMREAQTFAASIGLAISMEDLRAATATWYIGEQKR